MKKKLTYLLLIALLCCLSIGSFCQNDPSISCNQLPQKPNPATAVNDFANIIDDSAQQKMENDLHSYWDSTSIAIVVVTVQNMNGNEISDYATSLFRCWGIGSAATNRGVLLLLSMDEHKIWIATGYGVEGILPDITCTEIAENDIKPLCREGKYSDAVIAGVQKIIKTLGTMSWEERMEGIREEKAAEDKKTQQTEQIFKNIGFGIAFIVLTFFLVRIMVRNAAKRKLRKQLTAFIEKIKSEISGARNRITTAMEYYKTQPSWAREEAKNHNVQALLSLSGAEKEILKASSFLEQDPEKTKQLIEESHRLIEKSFINFSKIDEGLKEKIKKYADETPSLLTKTKIKVLENLNSLKSYQEKGYVFNHEISDHNDYLNTLTEYSVQVAEAEYQPEIYTQCQLISQKSENTLIAVSAMLEKRSAVTKNIVELANKGKEQYADGMECVQILTGYKLKYPENVWHDYQVQLNDLLSKLDPQRLDDLVCEILDLNDLKKQEFKLAASKYDGLTAQVEQIQMLCSKIRSIESDQQKQKSLFQDTLVTAQQLVGSAMKNIKDSDVTTSTRNIAKNAQQKLQEVSMISTKTILDWVGLLALLQLVISLANEAIKKAKQDISDAEEKREQRQRQLEDSYNFSSNSYSSSYTSSSGDSDFGGFGGGSSGGGGGGASW